MVRLVWSVGGAVVAAIACAVVGAAGLGPAPAQATGAPGVAALAIAVSQSANTAVVTVDLAAPVPARAFFLAGERPRFVVDLSGARWRLSGAGAPAPSAGPVQGVRYSDHQSGVSRLVLDLAGPGRLVRETGARLNNGLHRLSFEIELAAAAGTPPRRRPAVASAYAAAPGLPARTSVVRRTVVIDAGHGGRDPGAIGVNGAHEKAFTLQSALRLRQILEATGRYTVVLTRDADVYVDLADRVRFARAQDADLFISLHADAASNPHTQGVSVYTLSEQGGRRAQRIMTQQNWRLDLPSTPTSGAVSQILTDMAQRDTTNRSAAFARTLIDELGPVAPLLRNTHRNAGFFVLLAPDVPAVLVELGFMTNPNDERRLADPAERDRMMQAVARAIDAHFARPQILLAAG